MDPEALGHDFVQIKTASSLFAKNVSNISAF
jgi:hypothetical protein